MEYRSLGRSGVMVTPLCLGGMNFGNPTPEDEAIAIVNRALEAGINFIDTSNSYNSGESERIIGKALAHNGRRDQIVLATKVFSVVGEGPNERGASRYHIVKACEDSLRRLQTDRIDLYQLHRPGLTIPQEETLRAFDDLVRAGKVINIGCSTHPAWKVMEALAISERYGWARYTSEQPPYNLLDRRIENELVPLSRQYGLAILPWSPLAGGILAGRYARPDTIPAGSRADRWGDRFRERVTRKGIEAAEKVSALAKERGLSTAQLALLWVKDQPGVTAPIVGPRTRQHLEEVLPVLEMTLSDSDRPLFDEIVHPGNAVADFHNTNEWMKTRVND
ncbi:MAG: aldo/keto reductase [Chloroflexi bacterium]|nr:aldo/keto reductase [Chloroflexota bacterium]